MPSTIRTVNALSTALTNANTEEASIIFEIFYRDIQPENGLKVVCEALSKNILLGIRFKQCNFSITEELCDAIKESTHLKELHLPGNGIDRIGLEKLQSILSSNRSIETLNLANNNINDEQFLTLLPLLQDSVITTLNLTGNELTDRSISNFLNVLQENQRLQKVEVKYNEISPEKMRDFARALVDKKQASIIPSP